MSESEIQPAKTTEASPKKKRPLWRRLLKWLGILILLICMIPVGLLVGWQISFIRRPLVQFGVGFAKVALDGKVEIDDIKGDLLTHIILEKVSWKDRQGRRMAYVERLEARYDLMHFLKTGELLVSKVHLKRAVAAMGPKVYGLSPKSGGGVLIQEVDGSTPEKLASARQKYALVTEIIDLLSHISPTLPTFCQSDAICGPKAQCRSFAHTPPPAYRAWKGVCKDKPKPKETKPGTFKMRIPSIVLEDVNFDWVPAPQAKPMSFKRFYAKTNFSLNGDTIKAELRDARVAAHNPNINVRDLRVDFSLQGNDMRAKELILLFGKRSEVRLDAHLSLEKILGVSAKLKKIFVAPEDMKPIVPAWPVKPDIHLHGDVSGSLADIKAKIEGTIGQMVLDLDAKSGVLSQTYDVVLALKKIDLSALLGKPEMKSLISLKLTAKGKGFSDATDGLVTLDVTPGFFQTYGYRHVKLRLSMKDRLAQIKKLLVATPFADVDVSGQAHLKTGKFLIKAGVQVGNLSRIGKLVKQRLGGSVIVNAKLYGDKWMPIRPSKVRVTLRRFKHPSASIAKATINVDVLGLQPNIKAQLALDAEGIRTAGRRFKYLMLSLGYEMDKTLQKVSMSRLRFDFGSGRYQLQKKGWVNRRRQNLVTKLSFDTKAMVAKIAKLWLRRGRERIRVDGWIDLKRWRQDLTVAIKRLDLAALRRGLGIMPKSKLAGLVDLDVGFSGSFYRPRLALKLGLRNARFQKYKQLSADIDLRYATRDLRGKQRLALNVDVAMGKIKLIELRSSLPVGIALRGSLPGPLVSANPAVRVDLKAPLSFDLKVPDLDLSRLREHIGQPIKGLVKLHVRIHQSIQDPRFSLGLNVRDVYWTKYRDVTVQMGSAQPGKRTSVVKLKFGKSNVKARMQARVQYQKKRIVDIEISNASANFQIEYEKGRLFFEPASNWLRHKGLSMMTLAGNLPLSLTLFHQRRRRRNQSSLGVKYQLMPKKPINFKLTFPERKLSDFRPFLPASLLETVGHIKGLFGGHLQLSGLPFHPNVDLQLRLKKASLCPLENGKFVCSKVSLSLRNSKKKATSRSLRIHGVNFALDLLYAPPPKASMQMTSTQIRFSKPGNLQLSSQLSVRDTTLFEISKQVDIGGKSIPTGIALAFAVHPKTLKPFFQLFTEEPTRFQIQIPDTNISSGDTFCVVSRRSKRGQKPSLVDFVRLPILRRLRGQISLNVALDKKLSNPMAKVSFKFRNGGYLFGCDDAGRPLWIDGVYASATAAINEGFATASVIADVMKRPLVRAQLQLVAKAGLTVVKDPKTKQPVYKPKFILGKKIFARLLLCRFQLKRFGKLGGIFKKISGMLQGQLQLKGDPACPVLFSEPPTGQTGKYDPKKPCEGIERSSHIQFTDLILGDPIAKSKKPVLRSKKNKRRLHIKKLRIDLASIAKGRTKIEITSSRMFCAKTSMNPNKSGKAALKRAIAESRKFCPEKAVEPPLLKGFPWWFFKVRENNMFRTHIEGPLPLQFLTLSAREVAKRCPHWGGPQPSQALKLSFITPDSINLDFVESFVPGLTLNAYFGGSVNIQGDGKSPPEIKASQINLDIKRLKYTAYGVDLLTNKKRRIESKIRLNFGQKFLKLKGRLQGTEGSALKITGDIQHKNFVPQHYTIRVKTDDFRPMNTQKYRLTLKTDIKISKSPKSIAKGALSPPIWVRGMVTIPRLLFTLPEGSTSPSSYKEDDDIVILGEPSEKRLRARLGSTTERPPSSGGGGLNVDLRIVIPGNFIVRNRDLMIEARTNPDNPLRVRMGDGSLTLAGGIELMRGEVSQYGKRFTIQKGSNVSFSGQPMPMAEIGARIDPKIDVTAVYGFSAPKGSSLDRRGHKKVKIMLLAGGSLQDLKIDFKVTDAFSDQVVNLDRVNILSLILTGTTTDDLSAGQQKNIASQAFGMLGSALASELRNQLSGVLKVDVLNIDTGTSAQDIKVEAGWYLTSDIYFQIAGKPAPLDEENYWEAMFDYSISRQWSLELRFGQIKRNLSQPIRASGQVFYRLRY